MSSEMKAVLLPVGREILTGRVLDTNSNWLAQRLFEIGVKVMRICAVDDDEVAIGRELHRARADGARLVVTTGGLGPTPDDLTLKAVGDAIGRPVGLNEEALAHVKRRYEELHREGRLLRPGLTPEREKMAYMPKGAHILPNEVGTAPGAFIRWGKVLIFCLPGVPQEMKPMAENHVFPLLKTLTKGVLKRLTITLEECDESTIAAIIREVQPLVPEVHIKPDPKRFSGQHQMAVHFEAFGPEEEIDTRLKTAADLLRETLRKGGRDSRTP